MIACAKSFDSYKTTKAKICSETRQLIDQAVASGKITYVPVGVSGLGTPVWDGDTNRIIDPNLMNPNLHKFNRARLAAQAKSKRKAVQRRADIVHMIQKGLSYTEIATLRNEGVENTRKIVYQLKRDLSLREPS